MLFWLAMVLPILSDDRLIGRLTKFSPFQAFISRSPFFVTTCKICAKLAARGETMEEDILPFCSTLIHPFVKFVLSISITQCGIQTRLIFCCKTMKETYFRCRLPSPSISRLRSVQPSFTPSSILSFLSSLQTNFWWKTMEEDILPLSSAHTLNFMVSHLSPTTTTSHQCRQKVGSCDGDSANPVKLLNGKN